MRIPPPLAETMGLRMTPGEGTAVVEFDAGEPWENPMGFLQGGILATVADAAMGWAYFSLLEEGEGFTTVELKINYLRPVKDGTVTATARVVSNGRRLGLVECDLTDAEGRLVARCSCTCMRLAG